MGMGRVVIDLLADIEDWPTVRVVSERNLHSDRYMEMVWSDVAGFLKKYFNFPNDEYLEPTGTVPHVIDALERMHVGGKLVFQWFTDGAKSITGTKFFPILSLASEPDEAHILICENFDDSKRRLQIVQAELENNLLLTTDFPWIKKPTRTKNGAMPTWSRRELNVAGRSPTRSNPSLYAAAIGSGDIRQRRGKLIMDDVEGEDHRNKASERRALYDFVKLEAIRCWEDKTESKRPLLCAMGTPYDVDSIYIKLPDEGWELIKVPAYTKPWNVVSKYAYMKLEDGTQSNTKTPWEDRAALLPDKLFTWPRKRFKITMQDPLFGKGMTKLQFHIAMLLDPTGGDPMRLSLEQMKKLIEAVKLPDDGAWITVGTLDPAAGVEQDYCGVAVVRIRWVRDLKANPLNLPDIEVLECHRFEQGLFEQVDFAADLCWKYPETEEGPFKGRPCRLVYENNAMQGGTYKNAFEHKRPEIRLVPVYTSGGAKFDETMGLTVIRTIVKQGKLGVPASQLESEGVQTLLTEIRDLGSERVHDHISASIWFVVRWLWSQVRMMNAGKIENPQEGRRFTSGPKPGFFRPRHRPLGVGGWRR